MHKPQMGKFALFSFCFGSMVGAGIFALPQTVAFSSGVIALLISWIITFCGMISLAWVFQNLATQAPELDAGIYSYARAGLGDYLGFSSAWGYWISTLIGNIGYLIVFCAALGAFFPMLGDGTNLPALVIGSVTLWGITYLCLRGIRVATSINVISTFVKIIPLMVLIVAILLAFKPAIFMDNFRRPHELGSLTQQIKNTMLVTAWIFIGIEGASVFSARARNRADVGKVTIASFLAMFGILFAVSVLPFGILPRYELAQLVNPSTGPLLERITSQWGSLFMNASLVVAILSGFLSWVLISAEVPFTAAKKDQLFPKVFTRETANFAPAGALIISAILQQSYLIAVYLLKLSYLETISIATAMVFPPYLFSALYGLKLAASKKNGPSHPSSLHGEDCEPASNNAGNLRAKRLVVSGVAAAYGLWLLSAAGKYLLLSSLLYLIGTLLFVIHRKQQKIQVFNRSYEWGIFILLLGMGIVSITALVTHQIIW